MGLIKWENGGPIYARFYCRFLSVYVRTYGNIVRSILGKKPTYKNKKKGRMFPFHDAWWMEVPQVSRQ